MNLRWIAFNIVYEKLIINKNKNNQIIKDNNNNNK